MECDNLHGWINNPKLSSKMVNPRDTAGTAVEGLVQLNWG